MKRYGIKEIFPTLQGEGSNAGTPAVFVRFSGCNLGYDVCSWCDTDWVKPAFTIPLTDVMEMVKAAAVTGFGSAATDLLVVITGGERSLQFDAALSNALHNGGFTIAMETNGSR